MGRHTQADLDDPAGYLKDAAPLSEASYYILLALARPLHGYGIGQRILAMTGGRLAIGPGTMYGALKNMQRMGLIELSEESAASGRRIVYRMSARGSRVLAVEALRLRELLNNYERYGGEA